MITTNQKQNRFIKKQKGTQTYYKENETIKGKKTEQQQKQLGQKWQ